MLKQEDYKQHISENYNNELEQIKNHLLEMGGKVEKQLTEALAALIARDTGEAEEIINRDHEVNEMEMRIDDECATILARRQPAASDLRLVVTAIKVITDIERIGDEAAKIARQGIRLAEESVSPTNYIEIRHIGAHVASMLHKALDAFARLDIDLAIAVIREDDDVDKEYGSAMRSLVTFMMEDQRNIGAILNEMWALRSLERIGDHAANIAEHVVYLVRGLDIRHQDSIEEIIERPGS
ncbi:phosphate signaling complex protein PhoU [Seongchinamella sediminis]|uniref:Phosphate-specific transport system accessory protein PhoU n=1 Tax=Seongchinamella sediminis TaxID=2283635 RepID=A0A3L7E3T1_9GAMM|nr:phosphate signaling complex protein PhoU [Seongchinamella sediminis]RLQ23002.1 phosphate signaling complex protein PhoU [Seongchinamella sediminis]